MENRFPHIQVAHFLHQFRETEGAGVVNVSLMLSLFVMRTLKRADCIQGPKWSSMEFPVALL